MQNIQVICEKILQGPTQNFINPTIQTDTSFIELLETLTQIRPSEISELPNNIVENGNEEKAETKIELISQALNYFWMNNSINTCGDDHQILDNDQQKMNINVNQLNMNLVKTIALKYDAIQEVNNIEFKMNEEIVSVSQERFVIETVDKNEIQNHFRVLNQATKLKEIVKSDEIVPMNFSLKQSHEVLSKNEIELTDLQMNEFKQSIEEMKGLIEQISKKDDQTMIFKLKPEGLAEIVIKFEQKLGKVVLDISTSNRMVEQLIQKELPQLKDSLKSYQMEVNLNDMNFKNQSGQSQQSKYYQERQVFKLVEEENVDEQWVFIPNAYGFNTYV